jgi:ABC-type proline/glycine betaine transport system ATPase subunit
MDSSRILVMRNGRLAEFDRPRALLARKSSLFSELVRNAEELQQQSTDQFAADQAAAAAAGAVPQPAG